MKSMKAFAVKVFTLSGSSIIMLLESFDNSNDLKIAIIKKLKISVNKFPLFGLYEIYEDEYYEERYIEENELVMDLVSSWLVKNTGNFKILLKLRIFIYFGTKDQILPFLYIQSAFDVLRTITLVPIKIYSVLAALKLFIELGKSKVLDGYLSNNLNLYIPDKIIKNSSLKEEEWIEKILKKYNMLPDMSKTQAQAKFVELLSKCGLFGSSIFYLSFQEASGNYVLPKEIMMAVSSTGIVIYLGIIEA